MNAYIADQIAREHVDRLMVEGADARRARRAGKAARPASSTKSRPERSERSEADTRSRAAATAHAIARLFAAIHKWALAASL